MQTQGPQPQTPKASQAPRPREVLVRELKAVARRQSSEFWEFWWGMSKGEKRDLFQWAEEPEAGLVEAKGLKA